MYRIIVVALGLVMAACSVTYNPVYRFNEVQVVNLTAGGIENVRWQVAGSEKSLYCEQVARNAMCADRFPARRYLQEGIDINWTHGDGENKSETVNPSVPAYFVTAFPLRIVVEIRADGSLRAFYEQDEPGREGGIYISD